jgi:hypothetical protein
MDKKDELLRNIRGATRKEGTVGNIIGQTFKVGQYGNDVTLYNMEKSLEIQGTNIYSSLNSSRQISAEENLTLLDMEMAQSLREGDNKNIRRLQIEIEKAKEKVKELQKNEDKYPQVVKELNSILYLLFSPSNSPRYVPSNK